MTGLNSEWVFFIREEGHLLFAPGEPGDRPCLDLLEMNSLLSYRQQSLENRKIKQDNLLLSICLSVSGDKTVTQAACVYAVTLPLAYFLSVPVVPLWSECYLHHCGLILVFALSLSWITALKSKHYRVRPGKNSDMQENTQSQTLRVILYAQAHTRTLDCNNWTLIIRCTNVFRQS